MADVPGAGLRETNVFISYSRRDREAAHRLYSALKGEGFSPYFVTRDIAAGEKWKARLGRLIESADTIVFLISPDSVASELCNWEIDHAEALGKRIMPVVTRDAGDAVPEHLKRLNYIFMRTTEEERTALADL